MKRVEIVRAFHFYAAHRNENLKGSKCWNIHGHTYDVEVALLFVQKENEVTMLFDDIEKEIQPIIRELDHSFIINTNDKLIKYLDDFNEVEKEELKLYKLPYESNVENLALHIARKIYFNTGLNVVRLTLRETKSCTVTVYTEEIQRR